MKNRKLLYISILISILYMFSGCETKSNVDLLIISSPDNKIINYYEYDIATKTNKKIYSINKTCYPTATLSEDNKTLYFTKRDEQGYPQLFARNLSTSEEKQLTSKEGNKIINVDFLKINYNKDLIYLRVVQENHRNFSLAIYNIKSNELKILYEDEKDLSNQFFDFSNHSNSMLVFQNSIQEEFNLIDEANKSKNLDSPSNYNIVLKDENGKDENVYGSIKKNIIDVSLSPNKQSTIILTGEIVNLSEHKFKKQILLKDLNNNEPEVILSNMEAYQDITKLCFSKDGEGFYFVASESSKQHDLYYYDLKNKTTLPVLKVDNENILDCIAIHK
jgi:Tol biopolymer transport system component